MIHDYDTHFWLAKLPDGSWISAEDHFSYEPVFQTATKIRIEPLSLQSVQAILEAKVPAGYTAFLRTFLDYDVSKGGEVARVCYMLALERVQCEEPGKVSLDNLPLVDGFRAYLQAWDGQVHFDSSSNFYYEISQEDEKDLYKFFKRD